MLTCAYMGDTKTLKVRSGSVLILNVTFPLLPSLWGFSFAHGCGVSLLVGSNILLSMAVQQRVAVLEFSQDKLNAHLSTLPS